MSRPSLKHNQLAGVLLCQFAYPDNWCLFIARQVVKCVNKLVVSIKGLLAWLVIQIWFLQQYFADAMARWVMLDRGCDFAIARIEAPSV